MVLASRLRSSDYDEMKREIGTGVFDGISALKYFGAPGFGAAWLWDYLCLLLPGYFSEGKAFFPFHSNLSFLTPSTQHLSFPYPLSSYTLLPFIPGTHKDCGKLGRALFVLFLSWEEL